MAARGILILNFGSQYTQLIARRIRELGVYSEILPAGITAKEIEKRQPYGIILSGGPASVYDENAPKIDVRIFELEVPILGICYGMQLIAQHFGGEVTRGKIMEYGRTEIELLTSDVLFEGLPKKFVVWMSHGDEVRKVPDFEILARSNVIAAIKLGRIYGIQFHPEVAHTEFGKQILANFVFKICNAERNWSMKNFVKAKVKELRRTIQGKAIAAVSGGIDSLVAALLVKQAIGENLKCVLVDHGLFREKEVDEVINTLSKLIHIEVVDASGVFLRRLSGVIDPERKRRITGETFAEILKWEAEKFGAKYLVQGTIYPDVVESGVGSDKIKTHHNVGGLPKDIGLEVVEPLRYLFKDEVREIAKQLDVPKEILRRHPFPGPGLAVRVVGEVTKERLKTLRQADAILVEELKKASLYDKVWQAFTILLPTRSVGVKGDRRSYGETIVLRIIESMDGMTADWAKLPYDFLQKVANRITNEVEGVTRVLYDITSKPPATIEWE